MIHHIELWTSDLAAVEPAFDWILSELGWRRTPVDGWDEGRVWTAPGGEYLVLEESPAVTGPLDRMLAGLNHLALVAPSRAHLDQLRAEASHHGWSELFAEKYPHAGGEDLQALYLENAEGFELELVARQGTD